MTVTRNHILRDLRRNIADCVRLLQQGHQRSVTECARLLQQQWQLLQELEDAYQDDFESELQVQLSNLQNPDLKHGE